MQIRTIFLIINLLSFSSCASVVVIDNEKNKLNDKENVNIIKSRRVHPNHSYNHIDSNDILIPESIIFVITDGTGIGQYTLSYYSNEKFPFQKFNNIGLVATHPDDCSIGGCETGFKKVTDSASSATAYSTGYKTYNGAIGVNKKNEPLETVVEIAEKHGMNTGLIATSTITHATPASFASHINSRKKEFEIAQQLSRSEVDLLFGGGKYYWPDSIISNYIVYRLKI